MMDTTLRGSPPDRGRGPAGNLWPVSPRIRIYQTHKRLRRKNRSPPSTSSSAMIHRVRRSISEATEIFRADPEGASGNEPTPRIPVAIIDHVLLQRERPVQEQFASRSTVRDKKANLSLPAQDTGIRRESCTRSCCRRSRHAQHHLNHNQVLESVNTSITRREQVTISLFRHHQALERPDSEGTGVQRRATGPREPRRSTGLISIGPSGSSRYCSTGGAETVLEDGRLAGAAALHRWPAPALSSRARKGSEDRSRSVSASGSPRDSRRGRSEAGTARPSPGARSRRERRGRRRRSARAALDREVERRLVGEFAVDVSDCPDPLLGYRRPLAADRRSPAAGAFSSVWRRSRGAEVARPSLRDAPPATVGALAAGVGGER